MRQRLRTAYDKLRGLNLSATPSDGNIPVYNASTKLWTPQAPGSGGSGGTLANNLTAPPVLSNWAWINQGSAAAVDSSDIFVGPAKVTGIAMSAPTSGSDNLRILKKSVPSAPYTIVAGIVPMLLGKSGHFFRAGVCWRESGSSKVVTADLGTSSGAEALNVSKFTNSTTYSADYDAPVFRVQGNLIFIKIEDNNTNRIVSVSVDGVNFVTVHSVSRTDFLTADEIGFFLNVNSASHGAALALVHWVQS